MEADFSGYATKAGLKCTDGRTIMPNAFEKQNGMRVPLVWQHGHNEVGNVLGHAILENRKDGVYCQGFFNDSPSGQNARNLVQHGDITFLSIYANQLVEKSKQVIHGAIREVSLVLAGANPGAFIDSVTVRHSDGTMDELEDEAIIHTGLEIEHSDESDSDSDSDDVSGEDVEKDESANETDTKTTTVEESKVTEVTEPAGNDDTVEHADKNDTIDEGESLDDIYETLTGKQKEFFHFAVATALGDAADSTAEGDLNHQEGNTDMSRNVFDRNDDKSEGVTLSHDQLKTINEDAVRNGSFKESFLAHAVEYGIEDIDVLFPDAKLVTNSPELISRRMEWVQDVIGGTKHSPFSRIKSTAADLTADEARARGYVKGNKKKDEVIKLLKRVTTPTTIYKKQKLDRDDIIDITDIDVVVWLKGEMRLLLDEELARAVLVGDGREPDDEDKIDEDSLRPIAYDDDMYTHKVTIPSDSSAETIVESVLRARTFYKGTGTPTMYTTDEILTDLILQKDKMGRRIYTSEADLAAAMRVSKIVTVEVMQDTPDLLAIVVNLADYTMGADQGGNVSMFDDFDIDYNQYKYLIETRVSGALTKPKSALVINRQVGTLVTPSVPSYNGTTHKITIPNQTGVIYSIDGVDQAAGDKTITETTEVNARPAPGYVFPHNINTDFTYAYTA